MTRLLLLAALFVPGPGGAESLSGKRKELVEIQKQVESKKREIDEFRRQEYDLHRDLSKLKDQTEESRRRMSEIESRIRDTETKKGALRARLGALQLAEGRWRGVLEEELRGYQRYPATDLAVYGRAGLWEESFRRAAILEKVQYLEGVQGTRKTTEAAEVEARRVAAALQAKGQGARAEHKTRESLYQRTQAVYQETRGKMEQIQRAIRDLQDSALALTRLLRTLEKKSPYRGAGELPLAEAKRSLPWPAQGRVVSTFGREPLRELGTVMIHQGIRLATEAGAPVKPVKSGRIIFAGPFRSYGQVLIVDHGQAFYTIYGQLGELRKKKGDEVSPEEPIATAGGPDSRAGIPGSTPGRSAPEGGGALYFEIRQSGEALDPLEWLKPVP